MPCTAGDDGQVASVQRLQTGIFIASCCPASSAGSRRVSASAQGRPTPEEELRCDAGVGQRGGPAAGHPGADVGAVAHGGLAGQPAGGRHEGGLVPGGVGGGGGGGGGVPAPQASEVMLGAGGASTYRLASGCVCAREPLPAALLCPFSPTPHSPATHTSSAMCTCAHAAMASPPPKHWVAHLQ